MASGKLTSLALSLVLAGLATGCQHGESFRCRQNTAPAPSHQAHTNQIEALAKLGRRELLRYYETHEEEFKPQELLPIARCYAMEGEYMKARACYAKYVDAVPHDGCGWRGLGSVEMVTGRYDSAITNYLRAVACGDSESVRMLAGAYYAAGRFNEMLRMVDQLEAYAYSLPPTAEERFEAADLLLCLALKLEPPRRSIFERAMLILGQSDPNWPGQTRALVKMAEEKFRSMPE